MADESVAHPPFEICILQVGIVDCTPRPFSKRLTRVISLFYGGKKLIDRLSRHQQFLKLFGKPWISLEKFENNILEIFKISSKISSKIIFIEISKPVHYLLENCGNFSSIVSDYNSVIKKTFSNGYLEVYQGIDSELLILPDGHHLTKLGHKIIANKILSVI